MKWRMGRTGKGEEERTRRRRNRWQGGEKRGLEEKMEGGKGTKWREEERRKGVEKETEMKVLQEHLPGTREPTGPSLYGGACSADETFLSGFFHPADAASKCYPCYSKDISKYFIPFYPLNHIPWYEYTAFCLSNHQLIDIWVSFLAIVNNAAWNTHIKFCAELCFHFCWVHNFEKNC